MATGDVPDRKGHREDSQPEGKRNAKQPDANLGKCGSEHSTSATAENKPKRPQELRTYCFICFSLFRWTGILNLRRLTPTMTRAGAMRQS